MKNAFASIFQIIGKYSQTHPIREPRYRYPSFSQCMATSLPALRYSRSNEKWMIFPINAS